MHAAPRVPGCPAASAASPPARLPAAASAASPLPPLLPPLPLASCCLPPTPQTTSTIAAGQWGSLGVDASFDLENFKQGFKIDVTRYEGDDMEFEMRGASCAVRGPSCTLLDLDSIRAGLTSLLLDWRCCCMHGQRSGGRCCCLCASSHLHPTPQHSTARIAATKPHPSCLLDAPAPPPAGGQLAATHHDF